MRGKTECRAGEEGTSLLEVMFAALISLVVVGAVLTVVLRQGAQRRANSELALAMAAALNTIENVRGLSATDIPGLDGLGFDVPSQNGSPGGLRPVTGDPDGLPGSITVVQDRKQGSATLWRVAATVTWTGSTGRRELRLESLVGERKG